MSGIHTPCFRIDEMGRPFLWNAVSLADTTMAFLEMKFNLPTEADMGAFTRLSFDGISIKDFRTFIMENGLPRKLDSMFPLLRKIQHHMNSGQQTNTLEHRNPYLHGWMRFEIIGLKHIFQIENKEIKEASDGQRNYCVSGGDEMVMMGMENEGITEASDGKWDYCVSGGEHAAMKDTELPCFSDLSESG